MSTKIEPITYEFSTFQELLSKIPANRIEQCMSEIADGFANTKAMAEAVATIGGLDIAPDELLTIHGPLRWTDDGLREATIRLSDDLVLKIDDSPDAPTPIDQQARADRLEALLKRADHMLSKYAPNYEHSPLVKDIAAALGGGGAGEELGEEAVQ